MTKPIGRRGQSARLRALREEVARCQICAEHLPYGPRPVVQIGSQAKILIAGQAPGRRVHESGVPFDDPSGDRLRAWLGVDRETFYDANRIAILPMGFCYPGSRTSGDAPPRRECAPAWRKTLLDELPALRLILVLGRYALAYHLPGFSGNLTDAVRAWREFWPERLVIPHPSPRNRGWLTRHLWFEREVIPALRTRVGALL